ncbi:SPFH domain-containing protein [Saccharothrix sp. HUAS TT1]|uniref:SPFH domain-containing protein n=1 Tax=unclassified Saccharothrix TaxID=2593673 RepID=UPI00345B73E8
MKRFVIALMGMAVLILSACSVANTTATDVALHYKAGAFDSKQFVDCVGNTTKRYDDVSDNHFYYPSGQRDFDFGDGDGKDSAALTSTTKDGQELKVQGLVKFELDTSCKEYTDSSGKKWPGGVLQMMHETITAQRSAYATEGGTAMPAEWSKVLSSYLGAAIDRAADNAALAYDWQQLYTDTEAKANWERDVLQQIQEIVNTLTQGVKVFDVKAVLLQKPGIQPQLVAGLTEKQAAILRNEAATIDQKAAADFPGGIAGYQAYQQQQAINEAIKQGKVQVLPVPQGSPIIVGK